MDSTLLCLFARDPQMFGKMKVVVVGDIALDRSWRCRRPPAGLHATHGQETIFDVEPGGGDLASVGAAHNNVLFCAAFGAKASLWTVAGDDEDGRRVIELLHPQPFSCRIVTLEKTRTVSRLRFFVRDDSSGQYDLAFRIDQEPDCEHSYRQAEETFWNEALLAEFQADLTDADALLLNDTEKGFLSAGVIEALGGVARRVNRDRVHGGRPPLDVLVDPKFDWAKFRPLSVDILKPNSREAMRAVGLGPALLDFGQDSHLELLGERLFHTWGADFPRIVVTLGRHGAALLESASGSARLFRLPGIPSTDRQPELSTHCGDAFGSALALGFSADRERPHEAVAFANAVASLQHSKPMDTKIGRSDLLGPSAVQRIRDSIRPAALVAEYGIPGSK